MTKQLWIIGGPNGAGKTTFMKTLEQRYNEAITLAPNPDDPEKMVGDIQKQKDMLAFIQNALEKGISTMFETTLSGPHAVQNIIRAALAKGYFISLWYLYIEHVDLCIERVKARCRQGGHFVSDEKVKMRYLRGITHLFDLMQMCDESLIIDHGSPQQRVIALKEKNRKIEIYRQDCWNSLCYHNQKLMELL